MARRKEHDESMTSAEKRSVSNIRRKLQESYPEAADLIGQAIDLAVVSHAGQVRKSGEAYVLHPLAVAMILADEGLSSQTVIAGILHDLLEDTDVSPQLISEEFGPEILGLVDGVSKIAQLAPRGSAQRQKSATYRKLLLAAAEDARVLVVKLADRLHNMRTIAAMTPRSRLRIAKETLDVYAPLAHRLGMAAIRTELEDRSLAIVDPIAYEEAGQLQAEARRSGARRLKEMARQLRRALRSEQIEPIQIKSRVKSRYSIAEKRRRSHKQPDDIMGLRVILENEDDCYRALGRIHALYTPLPGSFDDYIAVPRANLYQSLHTTVNAGGRTVEIQIRTASMDEVAERGIAAHWLYKENLRDGGPRSTRKFIERAAENQTEELDQAFANLKADVFSDEIYVFTPRGEVRILPEGACAVDFAYAIHSDLGNRLVGARVDGKLQSLTRPLHSGQTIEVLTGKDDAPSLDWLDHVRTNRARNRIRSFHQAELAAERVAEGMKVLERELDKYGLKLHGEALEQELAVLGYDDPDEVAGAALRQDGQARNIARRILEAHRKEPAEAPRQKKLKKTHADEDLGIMVDDMSGVSVRLAKCCHPEPKDAIIGYVSIGHGVTIHKADCANVLAWQRARSPRLIGARWGGPMQDSFVSELELRYRDRPGLLSDIAASVYSAGAELRSLELRERSGVVRGRAAIAVTSADQSELLRESLTAINGSLYVGRH